MKNGSFILKLIFGLLGVVYAVQGVGFLMMAAKEAGDLCRIFTLPEEQLAFAVNGVVFTVLGVVFLLVALILLLVGKKKKQLREELLVWGCRAQGTIISVRVNPSVRVSGRNPLIVQVRCPFPSGEVTLTSPFLWHIHPAVGDVVDVLYDPKDESKYVIEFQDKK